MANSLGKRWPNYPHEIIIDLGNDNEISGVKLFPQQDVITGGVIKKGVTFVSLDGNNWGKSVAQSTFSRDKNAKEVFFMNSLKTRFVKLIALKAFEEQEFASLAEFKRI